MAKATVAGLEVGSDLPDRVWFYGPASHFSFSPLMRIGYAEAWLERDSFSGAIRLHYSLDYLFQIKVIAFGSIFLSLFPLLFYQDFGHFPVVFAGACILISVFAFSTRLGYLIYFERLARYGSGRGDQR
jgi:hypothetical protein